MRRSHCTSASNWELPLLCSPALQGTSSLENTIFCNILFFVVAIATIKGQDLYYVGWKDLRAIFRPNILFGKGNDTGWWGSPGRYGTLAILNVSVIHAQLRTYVADSNNLVWERDRTKVERKLCLNFGWEWSGHGRTSRTGSGAYEYTQFFVTFHYFSANCWSIKVFCDAPHSYFKI